MSLLLHLLIPLIVPLLLPLLPSSPPQGIDYATNTYDAAHAAAPHVPIISSETSSAVGDRGEYTNDPRGGHVAGYDTEYPIWGQPAEGAWGGVGQEGGQGILTRDFVAGGFTWTGWDYKGEPQVRGGGEMMMCSFPPPVLGADSWRRWCMNDSFIHITFAPS